MRTILEYMLSTSSDMAKYINVVFFFFLKCIKLLLDKVINYGLLLCF